MIGNRNRVVRILASSSRHLEMILSTQHARMVWIKSCNSKQKASVTSGTMTLAFVPKWFESETIHRHVSGASGNCMSCCFTSFIPCRLLLHILAPWKLGSGARVRHGDDGQHALM
eukprot:427421-Amphidinium_carterae.1